MANSCKDLVTAANSDAALDFLESVPDAYFVIEGVPGNPRKYLGYVRSTPRLAWESAAICMGLAAPDQGWGA